MATTNTPNTQHFLSAFLVLCFVSFTACIVTPQRTTGHQAGVEMIAARKAHRLSKLTYPFVPSTSILSDRNLAYRSKQIAQYRRAFIHHRYSSAVLPSAHRQATAGFSGELCRTDADCSSPRRCLDAGSATPMPCHNSTSCLCLPTDPSDLACTCINPTCLLGDVCSAVASENLCVSPVRQFPPIDCGRQGNLTREGCTEDSDCAEGRRCIETGTSNPCSGPDCVCFPYELDDAACSCADPTCLKGEVCVEIEDDTVCATARSHFQRITCSGEPRFTGEPCTLNSECEGPRNCTDGENLGPCFNATGCICRPQDPNSHVCGCPEHECLFGDVCSNLGGNITACISTNIALESSTVRCANVGGGTGDICRTESECKPAHACLDITGEIIPCANSSGCVCIADNKDDDGKFTLEECTQDKDCARLRSCQFRTSRDRCGGTINCGCYPLDTNDELCSCDNMDCLEGDVCVQLGKSQVCASAAMNFPRINCTKTLPLPSGSLTAATTSPAAVDASTQVDPSPSPTNNVCVAAQALSHLPKHELVYPNHFVAVVLCDEHGSCATAGHIVDYMGSGMMMESYCRMVRCKQRVMEVNSPRYRRGGRVASNTLGLEYTTFAARYGSRVEEAAMAVAVRLGF